jgi:hypothetical protein
MQWLDNPNENDSENIGSRRHHHPHDITIPLGDGGDEKSNWASELSVPLGISRRRGFVVNNFLGF